MATRDASMVTQTVERVDRELARCRRLLRVAADEIERDAAMLEIDRWLDARLELADGGSSAGAAAGGAS